MNVPVHSSAESVTIVTGLPRSGTSMMMQMLAAGGLAPWMDDIRGSDPDNPKGYFECEKVKSLARDNSWLVEAKGHAIKIVAPLLPNVPAGAYRIIFMDRDIAEILRSQSTMLQRRGKAGGRLSNEQFTNAFQNYMQRAEALIQREGYPALHVEYRKCVEQPSGVAGEVNNFLGSDLDEAAMAAAVDESLYRHRG